MALVLGLGLGLGSRALLPVSLSSSIGQRPRPRPLFTSNVMDNVFNAIKKDHRKLFWTAQAEDENRAWHFERADGSFTRGGKSLFWYGIQDVAEVERIVKDFEAKGRIERSYLPVGPSAPPHRVNNNTTSTPPGTRAFSTSSTAFPPTTTKQKTIGLIGARGYTGQALTTLINAHPYLSLKHVSSRQLVGRRLEGYNKPSITYENLSSEDVKKMEMDGEVDAWIMALPNGVVKPYVDSVDEGVRESGKKDEERSVIIDLGADYRF